MERTFGYPKSISYLFYQFESSRQYGTSSTPSGQASKHRQVTFAT